MKRSGVLIESLQEDSPSIWLKSSCSRSPSTVTTSSGSTFRNADSPSTSFASFFSSVDAGASARPFSPGFLTVIPVLPVPLD